MSLNFPIPIIDSNLGGCNSFSFISANDVVTLAIDPAKNKVSTLVLSAGSAFNSGYASFATLTLEEKMEINASGRSFLVKIKGFYPNLSENILALFTKLQSMAFALKITDNNMNTKLVGTPETPLKFTFNVASGRSPSARSGYDFEFSGRLLKPSPFIS